ncbi:hypothetical protein KGF57_003023 [Candida theae]|uniref:Uncharacterized protein n=1 Tax=Candida theae TaxID=1198502 RepID=A0AAD5FY50_9ASCO|nr:uncharacterized protein KGF57_003023 [Candida theae]KAI5957756.1 hypothetical protein KGF57_003023 [Candida theae]
MFKRKNKAKKPQDLAIPDPTNTSSKIDQISLLVSPDDIPLLYYSMKSIVTKLEPMMEVAGDLKNRTGSMYFVPRISSVSVDTTGLESNLIKFVNEVENDPPVTADDDDDDAVAAPKKSLDLSIAVTSTSHGRESERTTQADLVSQDIDLNQQLPFQNAHNAAVKSMMEAATYNAVVQDEDMQDVMKLGTSATTVELNERDAASAKECKGEEERHIREISNPALASLLCEYELETYEYQMKENMADDCTSSFASNDGNEDTIKRENETYQRPVNVGQSTAPQERDDYLTTILEEYSPFYNFPTDEEISEVERTYYNPYRVVFTGQF